MTFDRVPSTSSYDVSRTKRKTQRKTVNCATETVVLGGVTNMIEILAMAPIALSADWLRADQAVPLNPIHTRQIVERRRQIGRDLTAKSADFLRSVRDERIASGVTEIARGTEIVTVATVTVTVTATATATDAASVITSVSVAIEKKNASDCIAPEAIRGEIGMNWTMVEMHAVQ
jgi:hypothetical protein